MRLMFTTRGSSTALAGPDCRPTEVATIEDAIPDLILNQNLYGVDLSQEAVEITQLAALDSLGPPRQDPGRSLAAHRLWQQPGH